MKKEQARGASWGYAVDRFGELVIRNWYLVFGELAIALIAMVFCVGTILGTDRFLSAFGLTLFVYCCWGCYVESLGTRVNEDSVVYTVRLGISLGVLPLFRRTLSINEVLQASGTRTEGGYRVAYLTGEFGQAKILFDSKGGRDRFFAILSKRFPHIKVHRWS